MAKTFIASKSWLRRLAESVTQPKKAHTVYGLLAIKIELLLF